MSPLNPVETTRMLLPGILALTSILVVVITFLLERYTSMSYILDKETYRTLTWCMTFALIIGIVDSILSLPILLGVEAILDKQVFFAYFIIVIILFCICLLLVGIGTYKTVKKTLKKKKDIKEEK